MKLGIVGLPNVGKSTLFNAITKAGAQVANYAFTTIDPNIGVVAVPDKRLDFLASLYNPKRKVSATIEFFDIAGLVKGASKGEGLGNQFLANIRETEAIVEVVRCFEDKDVSHVMGKVDPLRDIDVINTELILADMETAAKKYDKLSHNVKSGDKKTVQEFEFAKKLKSHLEAGNPARSLVVGEEEKGFLRDYFLLTSKPILYACNVGEDTLPSMHNEWVRQVEDTAKKERAQTVPFCGKIEAELSELPENDQNAFLKDLGLEEPGLNRLIRASYTLLGLISFYTVGEDECRAWTITNGTLAPQAAGTIHTDFEKGFIRAEVMSYDDLKKIGSEKAVKEAGHVRLEGKEYLVKDGDIIYFRFNVSK